MTFFISHAISTRNANISPRANMGRELIWHVIWQMSYNNLWLLFAFFIVFVLFYVSLINFLLHHFQHTDSGNENIDWLNQMKWTTMQIYNIKGALLILVACEICTELLSHVMQCVAWFVFDFPVNHSYRLVL